MLFFVNINGAAVADYSDNNDDDEHKMNNNIFKMPKHLRLYLCGKIGVGSVIANIKLCELFTVSFTYLYKSQTCFVKVMLKFELLVSFACSL